MEARPVGSYEPTGIDVLIVGTGFAGLVAALECTRKGHNVRVLERNASVNTAGEQKTLMTPGHQRRLMSWNRRHVLHGTQRNAIYEALAGNERGVCQNFAP